ncbi:MAG: hypothetical protein ACXWP5_05035 [Bdellovibrionota bacterium]
MPSIRTVDYFIPEIIHHDLDQLRRARFLVAMSLGLTPLSIFFPVIFLLGGMPLRETLAILVSIFLIWVGLALFRLTRSLKLTGNLLAGNLVLTTAYMATLHGGFESPSLLWMALIPLVVTHICGKWCGIRWGLSVTAVLTGFFALSRYGYVFTSSPNEAALHPILLLATVIGVTATLLAFTLYRNTIQDELLRTIFAQHEELLAATRRATIGEVATGLAHEVNSPLGVVLGASHRISRALSEDIETQTKHEVLEQNSRRIERASLKIAGIIRDLNEASEQRA